MLKGKLRFRDEHLGEVYYDLMGVETYTGTKLLIMNTDYSNLSNAQKANILFDKRVDEDGLYYSDYADVGSNTRRLDISRVSKFKTNMVNLDFTAKISALIRYMQMTGAKHYNLNVLSEEVYFDTKRNVEVPGLGYIKFDTGLMTELLVQGKYVDIHLETVPDMPEASGAFKELKLKNNFGNVLTTTPIANAAFGLTEDILGFTYISEVRESAVNIYGVYETIEDVIKANPDKNTDWILGRHYEIVTQDRLEEVIQEFLDYDGYIAFDTETTGLKINFMSRSGQADELVGVVLTKDVGTGYYFPLQHKLFDNLCDGDHWYFMERYMRKLLETKKIVCHNIKFDWKVAYIYDINVNCVYDTQLALGVTKRYEEENFEMGLKAVVRNIFGLDMFDLGDFVAGSSFSDSGITFADLPYELVRRYAPSDTDMTLTLFEYLERENILNDYEARRVFDDEVVFAKAVGYSEFFGYRVDITKTPQMLDEVLGNMEKYSKIMYDIAGREFNAASPKQLTAIMYDELQIPMVGDKRSTKKELLQNLAEREDLEGNARYPFVRALLKFRENEGIHKNFLKRLHEFATQDGFIFPEVFQLGTNTGRTSVKNPNYQGYNDVVKKNIVPRSGFYHFDCDFSQIEYRVLASLAKQEKLMEEFNDPDLDYHTYQASRMFSIPYSLVSKALRGQSKGINFGLPYGMGDPSLGARIFGERNNANTAKASQLRIKFFQGQENIQEFFEVTRSAGVSNGFTSTHFGRRRYYHRSKFNNSEIRRQAGNHVIQGSAADIYKRSCVRMFNRIVAEGWLGRVLINVFVHDEKLMEVHNSINPFYFFKAWREEFELPIEGFCKLFAGAGVGMSWYDAKKQDLPPQYISEIIAQYENHETWEGSISDFLTMVADGYEGYKVRRIKDYITDPINQGHVIKPIINALLVEVVGNIVKEIQMGENSRDAIERYNSKLSKPSLIPVVGVDESGKEIKAGSHNIKSLKDLLEVYCIYYNVDSFVLDIRSPEDDTSAKVDNTTSTDLLNMTYTQDSYTIGDFVSLRGYYLDDINNVLYVANKPMTYSGVPTDTLNFMYSSGYFQTTGKFQVALYNEETNTAEAYEAYMDEKTYNDVVSLYNSLNGVGVGW